MGIDPQFAPTMDHRSVLGLGTADSENSMNDGAQDDNGCITVKRKGKMSKNGHEGHSMTNCHSMTKGHSMPNCHSMTNSMTNRVCGIITKDKAEQKAHK